MEANENYKVVLSNPGSSSGDVTLGTSEVTTTITSADTATWSISGDATVAEGSAASYTVSLAGTLQTGETATIDLGVTDVDTTSADYANFVAAVTAAIGARPDLSFDGTTLTYTGDGSPMTALVIDLGAVSDSIVEANENYKVVLSNPGSSSGDVTLGTSEVTTTITSADTATWSISGDATVAEGSAASYTVSLAGTLQTGETATIDLGVTDVDTTSADYANFVAAVTAAIGARPDLSFDGTTLTYTGDGSPMTDLVIDLGASSDSLVEGHENYKVVLTSRAAARVGRAGHRIEVTTTITYADTATWSISGASPSPKAAERATRCTWRARCSRTRRRRSIWVSPTSTPPARTMRTSWRR